MKKLMLLAALVLALAAVVFAPVAPAASPQSQCEAQGGVFQNVNGTKTCTITTTPGNNQGGVTKEETQSQKGSFNSSHPRTEEDCVVNRGGSHC